MQSLSLERPLPSVRALAAQIALWLPWALATPLIFSIHRRLPLSERSARASQVAWRLVVHGVLALSAGFLYTIGLAAVELLIAGMALPSPVDLVTLVWRAGRSSILLGALIYGLVLAAAVVFAFQRHARDREHELTRARLQALRNQLRPHFLFNTLHAIGSLVDEDPQGAQKMIARLSDLLRASLDPDELELVSLSDKLNLVRGYMEIEGVRFEDRLDIEWDIDDSLLAVPVPRFILQGLAENAIRHGIEPTRHGGRVVICARREANSLQLSVHDTGPGPGDAADQRSASGLGVGLANARARLAVIYGEDGRLEVSARDGGGTTATVMLPLPGAPTIIEPDGAGRRGGRTEQESEQRSDQRTEQRTEHRTGPALTEARRRSDTVTVARSSPG